jgi:hypothetical protein
MKKKGLKKMLRPTKSCSIIKAEIDNGLVKIVFYKQFKEYWVYTDERSGTLNSMNAEYTPGTANESAERKLKCIVVCEDQPDHIVKDFPSHLLVKGIIFNDVEDHALTDYLCKTERPPQA